MDKAELRRRFGKEVNAPDSELLWKQLETEGYVNDLCYGPSGWEEFKERADELAGYQWELLGRTKPSGRPPRLSPVEVELTDREKEHAAALAPYLAKRATLLPEVRAFREEKGGVLAPEQVPAFLWNELGWRLNTKDYMYEGWDLEDAAQLWAREGASWLLDTEELKDLVGGQRNRSRASRQEYEYEVFARAIDFDELAMLDEPADSHRDGLMHLISDKDGQTLEDLSRWLLTLYPWPLRDAAWFVLTNESPEVEPLKVQRSADSGAFRLTFEPWISEETIRRAYRSLQLGDNRPLEEKSLALFRFVTEYTEPEKKPKWAELTRRWNELYTNHKFIDRSALRRAYKRAERRLAAPWVAIEETSSPSRSGNLEF